MKLIGRSIVLAVFVGVAAPCVTTAQVSHAGTSSAQQKAEPAGQAKARGQQPVASAQGTPNCSGRPDARCTKKKSAKKLRTIF